MKTLAVIFAASLLIFMLSVFADAMKAGLGPYVAIALMGGALLLARNERRQI